MAGYKVWTIWTESHLPVDRRRHFLLGSKFKRIDDANDLAKKKTETLVEKRQ